MSIMTSGDGPTYHNHNGGYPPGSALGAAENTGATVHDLSSSFSSSRGSSTTSGVVSGEGSEGSGSGLHQRLVSGVATAGSILSREQGARDLRSIIQ